MNIFVLAYRILRSNIKTLNHRLWALTHLALAIYILFVSGGQGTLQKYLNNDLATMLGADTVVEVKTPIAPTFATFLAQYSDRQTDILIVELVMSNDTKWSEILLKAVNSTYPLNGKIEVSQKLGGQIESVLSGPKKGEIWLSERAIVKLNYHIGDMVQVHDRQLRLTAVLVNEPDRLLSFGNFKPNGLLNRADLSHKYTSESRQTHRFLLQQTQQQWFALQETQKAQGVSEAQQDAKFISVYSGKHPLSNLQQRIFNFIGLISIVLFLLAAIAFDLAGNTMSNRQTQFFTVAMSTGLTKSKAVLIWFSAAMLQFIVVIVLAIIIVTFSLSGLFFVAHEVLPNLKFSWSLVDILQRICLLLIIYFASLLPVLWNLLQLNVKALLVTNSNSKPNLSIRLLSILISFCVITYTYSDNAVLTTYLYLGFALAAAAIYLFTLLTLHLTCRLLAKRSGFTAIIVNVMLQRINTKIAQIVGIGLCIFVISFISILTENYSKQFHTLSFMQDGNLLVEQATPQEMNSFNQWLEQTDSSLLQSKPFVFGNLIGINGQPLGHYSLKPNESLSKVQKAIRLHWLQDIAGAWQTTRSPNKQQTQGNQAAEKVLQSAAPISVVDEVMTDLELSIGDRLTFQINGATRQYYITSEHRHIPGKSLLSFWFVHPLQQKTQAFSNDKTLFVASTSLSKEAQAELAHFWRRFPLIQMQPTELIAEKIQSFLQALEVIVLFYSGFLVMLSTLVVWTGINAYVDCDKMRNGLMLSFGLSKLQCYKMTSIEWLFTSFITSFGALLGAYLAVYLLYIYSLGEPFYFSVTQFVSSLLEGTLALFFVAFILNYSSFNISPINLLKGNLSDSLSSNLKSAQKLSKQCNSSTSFIRKFSVKYIVFIIKNWKKIVRRLK
ncbi:hypothetical protein Q4575_16025 [Psychrosphaera sp. 1_MG-2023]|uniref:ABC transporter permease n=1 Tax=Psychrosphaera sp. 1_MG-2023 TaxID=3062643 RepID=UPI0026E2B7B9|nr:FtsX-like permease family protein [Psychrosphaera sp. 1_MG-2023]MDO6720922.1 hypothetical protein [Psychrosphaera sp. 1_MG-2023]